MQEQSISETRVSITDDGERQFDVLIFDWDGTAVPDRKTPVPELIEALDRVLALGVTCVVVTGTHVQNLLGQGLMELSLETRGGLYLCTNRGSEVWGFDKKGEVRLLHRREATSDENAALDRSARRFRERTATSGLDTEIVSQRLNRRKIDLIPVARWADPKKSQFRELLEAVTERLQSLTSEKAPLRLADLLDLAARIGRQEGLTDPRITSDIKHIEIGLTDKSESVRWAFRNLIQARSIPEDQVAILGDEFGPIGDMQGSDAFLRIPELKDARFYSVGVEPGGVPPWVIHLGGGPRRFVDFLKELARLRACSGHPKDQDLSWKVIQEGFELTLAPQLEC